MIEVELNDHQARLVLNALHHYRGYLARDGAAIQSMNDHAFECDGIAEVSVASVDLVTGAQCEVETIIEMLER